MMLANDDNRDDEDDDEDDDDATKILIFSSWSLLSLQVNLHLWNIINRNKKSATGAYFI